MSDPPVFTDELSAEERRSKEISGAVEIIYVAKLMSDELEKYRNFLVVLTTFSLAVALAKVGSVNLFGIQFGVDISKTLYILIAILVATFIVGLLYRTRYNVDQVAKRGKIYELRRIAKREMEYREQLLRSIEKDIGNRRLRDIELAADASKSNLQMIDLAINYLQRHDAVIAYLPYVVAGAQCFAIALVIAGRLKG